MCNLYSVTTNQQAIRDFVGAARDWTGNLPLLPGVFPDYAAPIVRKRAGWRPPTRSGPLGHAFAGVRPQGPEV